MKELSRTQRRAARIVAIGLCAVVLDFGLWRLSFHDWPTQANFYNYAGNECLYGPLDKTHLAKLPGRHRPLAVRDILMNHVCGAKALVDHVRFSSTISGKNSGGTPLVPDFP